LIFLEGRKPLGSPANLKDVSYADVKPMLGRMSQLNFAEGTWKELGSCVTGVI